MIANVMKIYTKTGDQGETGLFSGDRVLKNDGLISAYGTVDELNSVIGLIRSEKPHPKIDLWLEHLQRELFEIGADLATPMDKKASKTINRNHLPAISRLEKEIDQMEAELSPLQQFILPGGTKPSALLHFARTVCRRAEREITTVVEKKQANLQTLQYMNRLSDWFFVAARYANFKAGVADVSWTSGAFKSN